MKKLTWRMRIVLDHLDACVANNIYGLPVKDFRKSTVDGLLRRGLIFLYSSGSEMRFRRVPEKKDGAATAAG